jgi:hypothetical protein
VFLVKKRDGEKAEQLFAMKVLDKEVITQKGQVAHTKVITPQGAADNKRCGSLPRFELASHSPRGVPCAAQ